MLRNHRTKGLFLVALGMGVLLALVLPVGAVVFCAGVVLIVVGCNCMRRF